jgi:hypothetical protein
MEPAAAAAPEKPKRVLSEEQKAKMAAGRAAAKARRDAEKGAAAPAAAPAEKPKRTLSDEQKAKMAAGRAAARERKAAAAPEAAGEKPAKPKRVLTDEQKAKMAAGRAAARERKAAEKANAVPAAAPAVEKPAAAAEEPEVVEVHLVDWEHDFGTGSRTYKRLDDEGMTYIYDHETRKYLGAYVEKTNKLKPSVPDPLAADD